MLKRSYRFLIRVLRSIYYRTIFKEFGHNSLMSNVLKLEYPKFICIKNNVVIGKLAWLAANPMLLQNPILEIEDGTSIGNFCHIYSTGKINIGAKVLIADKVYISNNLHVFEDVSMPIISQGVKQLEDVFIGDGCWIGESVSIIGASIGKNSVVGANSVVTKDIPDYCVAVGAPARIVKRYCFERNGWFKTNSDGSFKD